MLRSFHPAPEALLQRVFPPMLATLVGSPEGLGEGHRYELKIDGYRALAALSGGKVALWSRNALDLAGRFPHVAQALARIVVGEAVIDGEIAALDASGAPRFQLLQQGHERDAVYFAFDLLWLDGQDLRARPLEERRDLLASVLANTPASLRLIEQLPGPAEEALRAAKARGFEGIVAKERGSVYEPRRSRAWLKLKAQQSQELAIVGFTPSTKGAGEIGALHLAVAEGPSQAAAPPADERVRLTHPDKVLYPRDHLTKADLAAYFEAVREPLLRALAGRPLALKHFPKGAHDKAPWFQQDVGPRAPDFLHLVETPARTRRGSVRHLVADSPEALRWLAQHNVLEIHAWHSREGSLTSPDWVVLDLDPAEGRGLEQAIEVAQALHGMLERLGLPSVPKTSGKRGLHVYVPLAPGHTYDDALSFALEVGGAVEKLLPQTTLERSLSRRRGRLYVDCMQNAYGKTLIAPYSPRPVDGATVSAPLRWSEVQPGLDARAFTIRTMPERLAETGDLFAEVLTSGVRLPRIGKR